MSLSFSPVLLKVLARVGIVRRRDHRLEHLQHVCFHRVRVLYVTNELIRSPIVPPMPLSLSEPQERV